MAASNAEDLRAEWGRLLTATHRHLEIEESFGVEMLPFDRNRVAELRRQRQAAPSAGPASDDTDRAGALNALQQQLQMCNACGLGSGRTKLVFGAGNPEADLMFVGEAPGYHEDQQGIPFVGPAGQLLTKIIEAIGLRRDQVYIANVCKCRPPNNRTPLPDESVACFPFLKSQIDIIQPRIVVAMGNPAMKALLDTRQGITRMRGRFVEWNGIEVMPTFHPSYLLRNPAAKRDVWEDMQKVWQRLGEMGLSVGKLKSGKGS